MIVSGQIVDIFSRSIFEGSVEFQNGVIQRITRHKTDQKGYIMVGFVDAHLHIESSMIAPSRFGEMVLSRGTVAVVTDPHEIANVLGVSGVEYMMSESKGSPIKTFFTIPSCVPATPFDRSGGVISAADVEALAASGRFVGLSEMMNLPGVLMGDSEVMAKIATAQKYSLAIDGHAPLASGETLAHYAAAGISTDHECSTLEEAQEKLALGMKILIRNGSAALNFDVLSPLIATNPESLMFCTDDSHPDDILESGHIDAIVRRAVAKGFDLFDVLRIASFNPIEHYGLSVGMLREGDRADFMVVEDLVDFKPLALYVDGCEQLNRSKIESQECDHKAELPNNFNHEPISAEELNLSISNSALVIDLIEDQLVTGEYVYKIDGVVENFESNTDSDILKIVYINRYFNGEPQVAFCRGFGLKRGAIASTVGHDSHNIVAVGCTDRELVEAINLLISERGGLVVCDGAESSILPLPIGGIMSDKDGETVAAEYKQLSNKVVHMGCRMAAPFMTLSFMSLIVIPELKIGERGLFRFSTFDWV